MPKARIIVADVLDGLRSLEPESVQCCITSPPYWGLRDYGTPGQIGLEKSPEEYTGRMVNVFREVRRVLRDDGTLWLNLGDSYAGGAGGRGDSGNMIDGKPTSVKHDGKRIYRDTGALKQKDLVGIPWRVAFALQADGWWLRSDIIWAKPNPMPESVTDRPTKAHEYVFLLTKSARYFWDQEAVKEDLAGNFPPNHPRTVFDNGPPTPPGTAPHCGLRKHRAAGNNNALDHPRTPDQKKKQDALGKNTYTGFNARWSEKPSEGRNLRTVWTIATQPYAGAHFATFPPLLVEPMVKAGSREGDTVLDPFAGAGTTGLVALKLGRDFIGIELNPEYAEMARKRIYNDAPLFNEVT